MHLVVNIYCQVKITGLRLGLQEPQVCPICRSMYSDQETLRQGRQAQDRCEAVDPQSMSLNQKTCPTKPRERTRCRGSVAIIQAEGSLFDTSC